MKRTEQRIRMKIQHHSVKHDGQLIDFAEDGSNFTVRFDGPLPDMRFWQWCNDLVITKPPEVTALGEGRRAPEGAEFWQVL